MKSKTDWLEEIIEFIWWVQGRSYFAEIGGDSDRMKSALYEIDMRCRGILDNLDPDKKYDPTKRYGGEY